MQLSVLLPLLAWTVAHAHGPVPAAAPVPDPGQSSAAAADLARERALLEQARAALAVSDYGTARARAGEAVALLLARPAAGEDAAWLDLLGALGSAAWDAQDRRAAHSAWQRVLDARVRTLEEGHPDLRAARANVGLALKELGDLRGARALQEQVLEGCARTLADEDPELQRARLNLAATVKEQGDLQRALALEQKVLEVRQRTLPPDHLDLQKARQFLAVTTFHLGDLLGALALEEQVLDVYARKFPDDHPELQRARHNLAVTVKTLGDLDWARALEEQVLAVRSRTLEGDHPELQATRTNLALTMRALGDLHGARALQEQVLEILSRTLPDDHPHLNLARGNLAVTMRLQGDLAGACAMQQQALAVLSQTLPADHPDILVARQNLALTIKEQGDLPGARALEEQVLAAVARNRSADHPDTQRARTNLAVTLHAQGDLHGARALFEQVLRVRSRTLPDDHPDLLSARGNLAALLQHQGDLHGARAIQQQVLAVRARTLEDDHPALQIARLGLAATIRQQGDLAGARALEEQVLAVRSRTLPEDHPDLQEARQNLAATLQLQGDLAAARALQEQVLAVRTRTLSDDHPDLQTARLDHASALRSQGDLLGARALGEQVLAVRTRTLEDDHPDLQYARGNLAATLQDQGDFAGARALQEQVLAVFSRTLQDNHPDLQVARGNLAATIVAQAALAASDDERAGQRERCVGLVAALCTARAAAARAALLESSSREAEERCARLARSLEIGLSLASGVGIFGPLPELDRPSFVLAETARSAALASARIQRLAAGSPRYAELRAGLRRASAELATLVGRGTESGELRAALARREALERELVLLAKAQGGVAGLMVALDVEELAATLGEREVLVGFHRYPRWTFEVGEQLGATGERGTRFPIVERSTPSLCALVLRPGAATEGGRRGAVRLERVELGPIEAIESAASAWRASLGVAVDARGLALPAPETTAPGASAAGSHEHGAALRRLVFDPLLPVLAGAEHVVVALDDVLHLVPLDALPVDGAAVGEGVLLGDRWRIETRIALTERLARPGPPAQGGALVVLGGAAFDGPSEPLGAAGTIVVAQDPRTDAEAGILRGGAWSGGFADLPGTEREARDLDRRAREAFGDGQRVLLLTGDDASRERLSELAPRARWLHVATHGWFAPDSIRSWSDPEPLDRHTGLGLRTSGAEEVRGMSPMLLCGLALAGANLPADELGRVPGLMTAEEIATLDLSHCELAVLSACDTSVGDRRRAGQGVASLQRALQMAGARSVITSLWKVPDEATRELMGEFYRRLWVEGETKAQALWEAKRRLRDARDAHGRPQYTTRDWAAWVLTGEPD